MPDALEGEPTHLRARAISNQSQLRPRFFSIIDSINRALP
jgi:hypothetical protein